MKEKRQSDDSAAELEVKEKPTAVFSQFDRA